MNAGNRVSCRELFKEWNSLPLHSQYILSLLLSVVKNIDVYTPLTLDTDQTCMHLQWIWLNIKKEFITQGLKFSITYLKILRTYLGM